MILDELAKYEAILTELDQVMQDEPNVFQGTSLIVDVGGRNLTTDEILELEEIVNRQLGTRVLQVVNNEAVEILEEQGVSLGKIDVPAPAPPPAKPAVGTADKKAEPGPESGSGRAYLLRRTIRSGQRVTYDGSIVVLGDVNAGAEIIAAGDVVIVGALRGTVHAGARGRAASCVVALRMDPVQIRIAHVIGRAPDNSTGSYEPEVAFIRDGRIVIETLTVRPDSALWQGGNTLWAGQS